MESAPACLCCVADSSHCWDVLDGVYVVVYMCFWSWGSLFIPCAAVWGLGCCTASGSCCFLAIYRFGSLLCHENMFKSMGMETNPEGISDAPAMRVNTGRIRVLLGIPIACCCVASEGGNASCAVPSVQPWPTCPEAQLGATHELLFSCFFSVRCRIAGPGIRNSSSGCRCWQPSHHLLE